MAKSGANLVRKKRRRDIRLRSELHFAQNREGILKWFQELDRLNVEPFMKVGRRKAKP